MWLEKPALTSYEGNERDVKVKIMTQENWLVYCNEIESCCLLNIVICEFAAKKVNTTKIVHIVKSRNN